LITADDYRFFRNQNADYHLKVDDAGRAIVFVDDHDGGVVFELAAFFTQSNIPAAKEALVILIADLIQEAQASALAKAA
jgi:hypothetical protein